MPNLNFGCLVLWRQVFIPIHAPMLPPRMARVIRIFSETLHLLFFALYLSIPYIKNVTILIIMR